VVVYAFRPDGAGYFVSPLHTLSGNAKERSLGTVVANRRYFWFPAPKLKKEIIHLWSSVAQMFGELRFQSTSLKVPSRVLADSFSRVYSGDGWCFCGGARENGCY
jgi:hypothetical protein